MIDFAAARRSRPGRCSTGLLAWTEPARERLGLEVDLPERNGAQRAREALDSGVSIEEIYRDSVAETRRTYAGAGHAAKPA